MPPDPIEDQLDQYARQVAAAMDALFQRVMAGRLAWDNRSSELSGPEIRALGLLSLRGRSTMSAFAESLGAPLSTATHVIDRLVSKGLVDRKRSDSDRRIVEVELSEEGQRTTTLFHAARHAMLRSMLEALSPGERALYLELTAKMARTAKPPQK